MYCLRFVFYLPLLFSLVLFAQEDRASISGLVKDSTGAAIPDAKIVVTSVERRTLTEAVTTDTGRFVVNFLNPGSYLFTVERSGFKKYIQQNIVLATGEKLGLDVVMEVGQLTDSVTVTERVGLLETESSSRGQVITNKELHELPNQGRNVFQMVWAAMGVTRTATGWGGMSPQGVAGATNFMLNGGRPSENEVLLDGVSDVHGGRQVKNVPNLETVDEFKVIASPYDAQYGRTGGGVITFTTKSGTNNLHGVAWEFVANRIFNANSFALNAARQPRPQANTNVFGFEVDGPVYLPKAYDGRNKLFFMFSYEGWRGRGVDVPRYTIPSTAQRGGDFSSLLASNGQVVTIYDPLTTVPNGRGGYTRTPFGGNQLPANRISPIASKVISFYPQPTWAGEGPGQVNNYTKATPNIWGINQVASRMDYQINNSNRAHFRYSNTPFKEVRSIVWGTNEAEPSGNAPLTRNGVNWSLDWTSTLNPTMVFNLRFGLTRWEDHYSNYFGKDYNPAQLGFPQSLVSQFKVYQFPYFTFGNNYSPIGSSRPANWEKDYAYSLQPNLNLVRGSHVIKLGVELKRFEKNRIPWGLISGTYSFSTGYTQADPLRADAFSGNDIASFLLGYPAGGGVDDNMHPAYKNYYYAAYLHDDWKVNSRLTLNLGFRWDYEAPLAERYNRMVRGFDFDMASPIASKVQGLTLKGGLLYAGTSGNARQAYNRDYKHPQPRVGFAYKLNDKTVMRGGYGVFFLGQYEEGPGTGFSQRTPLISSVDGDLTPAVTLANPFPSGLLRPIGSSQGASTNLGLGMGVQYLDRTLPYSQQWSLGFQRELPGGWTLDTSYSANYTRRLPVGAAASFIPTSELFKASSYYTERVPNPMAGLLPLNAAKNGATITRQDLLTPYPQYAGVGLSSLPIGKQWYHSWQNRISKRFSRGYTLQATYVVSKTLEAVSLLNAQDFSLRDIGATGLERRLLQFDVPQKLTALGTYEIPVGRGKKLGTNMNGLWDALVGGWQLNGNLTLQSGFPAAFPNAAPLEARSAVLSGGQQSWTRWFDTSLFPRVSGPAPFTLQTFPTRSPDVRLHGLRNMDASLFKDFRIREGMKLNFRLEWYNITNTPWFPNVNTTVTSATFGYVTLSQSNTPKRANLGLRLVW
ncbi:MAG: carboxypeptidase regulatory-like domain-containing protein [Bryobacteraceae bacterium]